MSLIIANMLCVLAFFAHAISGDRELRAIYPATDKDYKKQQYWTMARCGWHWISFDLLATSVLLALINFSTFFQNELLVLQLLTVYFFGYGFFWLMTILISKSFPKNLLYLGQWMLLWVIALLIWLGYSSKA